MNKKNTIIVVIIIIILAIGGYYIFHKKSQDDAMSTSGTDTAVVNNSVVSTKHSATLGNYLVDTNGNTLYIYDGDTTGVSNCSGACLTAWPPYRVTTASTALPTNITVIKRGDGGVLQYAYKGKALYLFANETRGKVTGNGTSGFYVAQP